MKLIQFIYQLTPNRITVKLLFIFAFSLTIIHSTSGQQINPDITNLPQRRNTIMEVPQELLNLQRVTVPRLVGRDYNFDEVVTILDRLGLQMGEVIPLGNNDSIGIITSQQPAAGQSVLPQTRVNISYGIEIPPEFSAQPDLVTVPNYIGMQVERAQDRMPNDRLDIGDIREDFSNEPPGIIIAQFPEPGMEVDPGTPMSFVVSRGEPPQSNVEVPLIVGETLREAAEILRQFGLTVGELIEETSDERVGIVLAQDPGAGSVVRENSPVNIVYSVQEELVTVPDVRRLSRNEAIVILKETGLNYLIKYSKNNDVAENTVTDQEPLPGNRVPPGSEVMLLVSEGTAENWIYWGVGIVAAALAGGFAGRKIKTGRKKNTLGKKDMKVDLNPKWDVGNQQITWSGRNLSGADIHLKFKKDSGIQTIKTDKNEV